MNNGRILILCGSSGSGKTTVLLRLLDFLADRHLICRGILCPPVTHDGRKMYIDLLDVSTQKVVHLAEPNMTGDTILATHGWKLNPQAVHFGNKILEDAVPCDILFVDELGPLEYEREEGFLEGFAAINSGEYQIAFITVRPTLLDAALQRWPHAEVVNVNRSDQQSILRDLQTMIPENNDL